jgi:hypothetical protein
MVIKPQCLRQIGIVLPLDDDKVYFVCYVVPGVFEIGKAYSSVVAFFDFLGSGRYSEDFEPVFDDLRVPFGQGLIDLSLYCQFVSNSYDMNRNFRSIVQLASEVDKCCAVFISSCFLKSEGK